VPKLLSVLDEAEFRSRIEAHSVGLARGLLADAELVKTSLDWHSAESAGASLVSLMECLLPEDAPLVLAFVQAPGHFTVPRKKVVPFLRTLLHTASEELALRDFKTERDSIAGRDLDDATDEALDDIGSSIFAYPTIELPADDPLPPELVLEGTLDERARANELLKELFDLFRAQRNSAEHLAAIDESQVALAEIVRKLFVIPNNATPALAAERLASVKAAFADIGVTTSENVFLEYTAKVLKAAGISVPRGDDADGSGIERIRKLIYRNSVSDRR
jgi:hypothetical protein